MNVSDGRPTDRRTSGGGGVGEITIDRRYYRTGKSFYAKQREVGPQAVADGGDKFNFKCRPQHGEAISQLILIAKRRRGSLRPFSSRLFLSSSLFFIYIF